jgi:hypothetical protein
VDYKTTLGNARKKCNKNKFFTGYYSKSCSFPEDFHTNKYCPGSKKKSYIVAALVLSHNS